MTEFDDGFDGGEGLEAVGNDTGRPTLSAADIARAAASEALRGGNTTQPGERFTERPALPSDEQRFGQFHERQDPPAGSDDEIQQVADEILETASLADEDWSALEELGFESPVPREEIPQEYQDLYARTAQETLRIGRDAQQRVVEAERRALEAAEALKDVKARLSTPEGQKRLLLALAMSAPEVFTAARDEVEQMNADPRYADMVRRSLEADAKLEAAQRMERAQIAHQQQSKGQMIESRTVRLAQKLGVDVELAKEVVAGRILQNERVHGKKDITTTEVDEVLASLAKRVGAKPGKVKTPAAQARVDRAPQKPAAPAGRQPKAPEPAPSRRAPANENPLDAVRSAVRQSNQRLRGVGQ